MKEDKNPESLRERLHGWFLGLQIEKEPLLRCLLMLTQIVFFALLKPHCSHSSVRLARCRISCCPSSSGSA